MQAVLFKQFGVGVEYERRPRAISVGRAVEIAACAMSLDEPVTYIQATATWTRYISQSSLACTDFKQIQYIVCIYKRD